jgi:hypothetical protein
MIQYAWLNKKKNCLAYFSFFLILKYLFNLILAKIPEPGRAFDQLFFQKSNSPGGGAWSRLDLTRTLVSKSKRAFSFNLFNRMKPFYCLGTYDITNW